MEPAHCANFTLNHAATTMEDLKQLELTVNHLIEFLDKIKAENQALKSKLEELSQEKSLLMQKNDQAKNRLESMISRLKTLEQTA
jgi:cell division protein ZapB